VEIKVWRIVKEGTSQFLSIEVYDSLESLKSDEDHAVSGTTVKVEILYPSSEKDTFEPVTNEKGQFTNTGLL